MINELPITSTTFLLSSGGFGWSQSSHQHSHSNWIYHYRVVLWQSAFQLKKITAFKITTSFPGHCPSCQGGFVICLQRALENLVFLSRSIIWGFLFLGLLRQVLLLSPGSYLSILNPGIPGVYVPLCLACSCHVVWHANVWDLHLAWQTIIQLPNYFRVTSAPQILLYSSKQMLEREEKNI